jgi:hypothetical protein
MDMNLDFLKKGLRVVWIATIPLLFSLIIFRDAIFSEQTLFHMDWAPYFPRGNWIGPCQLFVERHAPFSLMYLMKACLPLRFYHVAFYIVAISGTTMALYAYLRDRGLVKGAALLGGIAFGFSGYCVSLVSAGHRGIFEACLSAAVLLFVGARAIRRGNWYYYGYAALSIALVIGTQPDVFIILLMVVGPLLLVDLIRELKLKKDGGVKKLSLGLLVFAVAMTLFGWRGVEKVFTNFMPGRETLIEKSGSGADTATDVHEQKWIFCTNWSLPPLDCVELAVPLVLGIESTDRDVPFWGELGRPFNWEPGQSGFPNYRQNTVYAGGIQLVLAFYAVLLLFRRSEGVERSDRSLLITATALVVMMFLLALGRYAPFYRLFYALPLVSSIRCPVKFLHAVNLAGAILCAFGGQALMMRFKDKPASKDAPVWFRAPEGWVIIVVSIVLIGLIVAKAVVGGGCEFFEQTWSSLGYNTEVQKTLLKRLNDSLVHAVLVFGFIGGVFAAVALKCRGVSWSKWVPWACAFAVAVDMTIVNSPYVNTRDLSVHEMKNVIVEDITAGKDTKPRVLDLITGWNKHNPIRVNLANYYSQDIVLVGNEQLKNSEFIDALKRGGASMQKAFQDYDVEYIIAPATMTGTLLSFEGLKAVGSYGFDGKQFIRVPAIQASVILLTVHRDSAVRM